MPKRIATYQYIADILSFESSTEALETALTTPNFDWDAIVVEGSKHLVLPALYCRLKSKGLLHLLPDELSEYLEEITNINRNRNKAILAQVRWLSNLFNTHHINHVFLKGAAVLAMDLYEDMAERMIGDIDVLIDLKQLDKAYNVLLNENFVPGAEALGSAFFEHKHLPKLKTKDYISAVELHRKLFITYKDRDLTNKNILEQSQIINNIAVPSHRHLLKHNILNHQVEDKAFWYNFINYRSVYDTINIIRTNSNNTININNNIYKSYFNNVSFFFGDVKSVISKKPSVKSQLFLLKLRFASIGSIWNKTLNLYYFFRLIAYRSIYFIRNKSYRNVIINDRKRIFNQFISIIHKN